jgi:hypothetical protein
MEIINKVDEFLITEKKKKISKAMRKKWKADPTLEVEFWKKELGKVEKEIQRYRKKPGGKRGAFAGTIAALETHRSTMRTKRDKAIEKTKPKPKVQKAYKPKHKVELQWSDEKIKRIIASTTARQGMSGEAHDAWIENRVREDLNLSVDEFDNLMGIWNGADKARTKKMKKLLGQFKRSHNKWAKKIHDEATKWRRDPQYKTESTVDRIDVLLLTEGAMGKKAFKKVVSNIERQVEENENDMKMQRFWDKWDRKVHPEEPHDLYVDEILWRIFDSTKLWKQFEKEWIKMGYSI